MKQLSSMMTGSACSGSSTPPMPTPPEMWQFLPICAQEPTVAQVSTIVPLADMGADIDEARHQHDARRDIGRAAHDRSPARRGSRPRGSGLAPAGEFRRHLVPPGGAALGPAARISHMSLRRNDSSTAFFSHWLTRQPPRPFSATRALPLSSRSRLGFDGIANLALCRRRDRVPVFPCRIDGSLQFRVAHGSDSDRLLWLVRPRLWGRRYSELKASAASFRPHPSASRQGRR